MRRFIVFICAILIVLGMVSCLGPGLITNVGPKIHPDPDPDPDPDPPVSWYIRTYLPGIWNYVFSDSDGNPVQMYWVDQKVDSMGNVTILFYTHKQLGTPVFRSEGVIDMVTGAFQLQTSFGTIGPNQGFIMYEGSFNPISLKLVGYRCVLRQISIVDHEVQIDFLPFSIEAIRSGYSAAN